MKVIDLLNKIANGEEAPYRVKYFDIIYRFDSSAKTRKKYIRDENGIKIYLFEVYDNLNDEVEIIEEDKKIESLINCVNGVINGEMSSYYEKTDLQVIVEHNFKVIQEKINEIIDKMNKE